MPKKRVAVASTFPHVVDDQLDLLDHVQRQAQAVPELAPAVDESTPGSGGSSPPRRIVRPAPVARPTGVACRVCGLDDGDERVQRDLHRRCLELATDRALRAKKPRKRHRDRERRPSPDRAAPLPGPALDRAEVIARLAGDRAATRLERAIAAPARRRGRPPKGPSRYSPNTVDPHVAGDDLVDAPSVADLPPEVRLRELVHGDG